VLPRKYAEVFQIKQRLLDLGAMVSSMTGSGPTVFGMFHSRKTAEEAAHALRAQYPVTYLAENTGKSV